MSLNTRSRYLKIGGYLISLVFFCLTFRGVDIAAVFSYLGVVDVYYLIAAMGFNICFFAIRSLYQINNLHFIKKSIPFSDSITSIGIAQFYNVIFPARIGEIIRTYFLSKRQGIKKASVLSYILVEKVMDVLLIMALLLLIIVFFMQDAVELVNALAYFGGMIFLVIAFLIVYLRLSRKFLIVLKRIIPKRILSVINGLNEEILDGLQFFRSKGQIAKSVLLLLLSWTCILAVFGFVSYPYVELFGLPFYSCLVFMVFSALSLSVPSAPAGIGVMHYGLFLAVKILGGDLVASQTDMVAAFVISTHFFVMLFDVLVGGGIMITHGLSSKGRLVLADEYMNGTV